MKRLGNIHILMYSHDTFGLGHLRRCRAVAHSLVENFKGVSILIVTGSQIAGAFNFSARVDFVKIPSVIKLYNGEYTSIDKHIDLTDTLQMRQSIIQHTAESFQPDIMIVDKEPLGLRGEMLPTLEYLKKQGCRLVLGLRDVMDSPEKLEQEWAGPGVLDHVERLYDDIWVYGPKDFHDPLQGLDVSPQLRERMTYLGFLRRAKATTQTTMNRPDQPYLLITGGGGGDGARLMSQVLDAYSSTTLKLPHALLVLGPLMPSEKRTQIFHQVNQMENVDVIEFDNNMENLIEGASGIVGMCGYNTFCEVLSFNKPALIVPRTNPREEQYIRARRGADLGLVRIMLPDEADDAEALARELEGLSRRAVPYDVGGDGMLNGLESINEFMSSWAASRPTADLYAMSGAS
jgi:predicted glycosyltransferase